MAAKFAVILRPRPCRTEIKVDANQCEKVLKERLDKGAFAPSRSRCRTVARVKILKPMRLDSNMHRDRIVRIDSTHSRAISAEIAARLRVILAKEQQEVPSSIKRQIDRLRANTPFGPEEIARLVAAHEKTLRDLSLKDCDDPLTELVAKKIIEIGRTGIQDPREISKLAIKELGIP
jgi:hypothetical protein